MTNNDIGFVIYYGAIAVAGFCIAMHYWYHELYRKRRK